MLDAVESTIQAEMVRLQIENDLLDDWIRKGSEDLLCATCGKPIGGLSIQRKVRPFKWCSRKCFEWKPRKIIRLEREYGLDIKEVLIEVTRRYGSIKAQCQALGISPPYLYSIIRKYFGSHTKFMINNTTGKRKQNYVKRLEDSRNRNEP